MRLDNPLGWVILLSMVGSSRGWLVLARSVLALSLCVGSATAGATAVAPAVDPHGRLDGLIAQADAARKDGRHADAARLYAEAYGMTTTLEDYRASDVALDLVLFAAKHHRKAFEASSEDYSFCQRSRDLLLTAIDEWRAVGRAVPQPLLDELRWVEDRLAEMPPPVEPAPGPEREPTRVPTAGAPARSPPSGPDAASSPRRPSPPNDDAAPSQPRKGLGSALVSSGAAATVAGAVLLTLGAPLGRRAQRYRTEALHAPEFVARSPSEQLVIEEHLDAYVADEQRRGIALMATGGAVLGVGVAAIVVGSLRLTRAHGSRGSSTMSHRVSFRSSVGRRTAALGLSLAF